MISDPAISDNCFALTCQISLRLASVSSFPFRRLILWSSLLECNYSSASILSLWTYYFFLANFLAWMKYFFPYDL